MKHHKPSNEYFAGLFDGEGYVRIDSHHRNSSRKLGQDGQGNVRYCINAGLAMTYMPAIKRMYDRWSGYYYADDSFKRKYGKNRIIFRWVVTSLKAETFLRDIQPFSIVKREQIDIALAFQDHVREHKAAMLGNWLDPKGLARQNKFKAKIFAVRAKMCEDIRLLKKEEFPKIQAVGTTRYE